MAQTDLTWQATAASHLLEARKKHSRLGTRKSRSGCQTCKTRRIKCDETRPECEKCTRTGRRCDGFPAKQSVQLKKKSSSLIGSQLSHVLGLQDGERRTFDFFLSWTAPRLAGSLDKEFWCGHVLKLAQAESLVLDSLLAISTLYEHPQFLESFRSNPFKSTEEAKRKMSPKQVDHPNIPPPPDEFHSSAIQLYNRAIRKLKQRLKEGTATPLLALLSCTLFLCIEVIRDNVYAALSLFTRGTELLRQHAVEISQEKEQGLVSLIKMMFSRLGVIAASLGYPPGMEVPLDFVTIEQQTVFKTIADARTALFALMADSHGFIKDANTWKESLIMFGELAHGSPLVVSVEAYPDAIETMYGARFRELDPVAPSNSTRTYDFDVNDDLENLHAKSDIKSTNLAYKLDPHLDRKTIRHDSHSPVANANAVLVDFFEQIRLSYLASMPPNIATKCPNLVDLPEREMHFQKRLKQWLNAFQLGPRKQAEKSEPETVSYLLMYYHASFVWHSTRLNPTQRIFDDFTHNFEELVRHAEVYIKAKAVQQPTFTFEIGAVPPLYFTATKCRIPLLRRKALDLINQAPRKECVFGAHSSAELASRIIEIEEAGLDLPPPDLGGMCAIRDIDDTIRLAEEKRVHNVELLKNKATESFIVRTTRYSELNGRLKRHVEDAPL